MSFGFHDWARFGKRLLRDRNGQRVPLMRNYVLQYAVAGTSFVLAGLVTVTFGNALGTGLIAFGLIAYAFAAMYYRIF